MEIIKGYKAFKRDASGNIFTEPQTKKRNYFEVGNTYSVSNNEKVETCENGFHFCRKLNQVFRFYAFSISIAYCEVEGISENNFDIDEAEDKLCTRKIKIIKELTFTEVLKILETELDCKSDSVFDSKYWQNSYAIQNAEYVKNSVAVSSSDYLDSSFAVSKSHYINNSKAIKDCRNIIGCEAVYNSLSIINSRVIYDSYLVSDSRIIDCGYFIINSENIKCSKEVINAENITFSKQIKTSKSVYDSFYIIEGALIKSSSYIVDCNMLNDCLFCYKLSNKKNYIFNKKVQPLRLAKIKQQLAYILGKNGWHLKFTNYKELVGRYNKGDTTLYDFVIYDNHFENFPEAAIEYLKSLPEFNAKIFKAITNIDVENK